MHGRHGKTEQDFVLHKPIHAQPTLRQNHLDRLVAVERVILRLILCQQEPGAPVQRKVERFQATLAHQRQDGAQLQVQRRATIVVDASGHAILHHRVIAGHHLAQPLKLSHWDFTMQRAAVARELHRVDGGLFRHKQRMI